ncbi:MAG: hypothetical protein KGL59_13250 [Acidobacteriota bacterium]|nr:hypothetical protein [Acidobacteriota bacterium]
MRTSEKDHRMLSAKRGDSTRSSETGAVHPAVPAVILLVSFAMFMAAIAPLDFTTIFHRFFPTQVQQVPHQDAAVWADKTAGVYYCADSILFGKTQGAYMKQVEALDRGYQPALGTYCSGPAWPLHGQFNKLTAPTPAPTPKPPSAQPASPSPFENPNYKPQAQKNPNPGGGSAQQFIPD